MGHGRRKRTLSHFQFITLNFSHNSPLLSPFSWHKKTLLKMANSLSVQVPEWLTCVRVCLLSPVWLSATPWTGAHQAPLSMGFSKQDYWSGLSFPTPGDLPGPEMKPSSSTLAGRHFTTLPLGSQNDCCMQSQKLRIYWERNKLRFLFKLLFSKLPVILPALA